MKYFYCLICFFVAYVNGFEKPVIVGGDHITEDTVLTLKKKVATYQKSPDVIDPEGQVKAVIEEWLENIEDDGIDAKCARSFAPPQHQENITIGPASSCEVENATREWIFTGSLNSEGYPDGPGIFRIEKGIKKSTKCLIVQEIFGSNIQELECNFKDGLVEGQAKLSWPGQEDNVVADVVFVNGTLHGPYRVSVSAGKELIWTYGIAINGSLSQKPCWVVVQDQVRYGVCEAPFVLSPKNQTVIFGRKKSALPTAETLTVAGKVKGENLVDARDVFIREVYALGHCMREMAVRLHRTKFTYDLKSRVRKFKLFKPEEKEEDEGGYAEVCDGLTVKENKDKASEALRKYFKRLTFASALGMISDTSTVDNKKSEKLLNDVEIISENRYEAVLTFFDRQSVEFRFFGNRNDQGEFDGYAVLLFTQKTSCFRGDCTMPDFSRMSGHFVDGVLQGPVSLTKKSDLVTYGFTVMDGVVNGIVVGSGLEFTYPYVGNPEISKGGPNRDFFHAEPTFIARFVNGRLEGKIWRGMVGESEQGLGYLYGYPEKKNGNITDSHAAYIYPWYESGLVGKFNKNVMVKANYGKIKSTSCQKNFMDLEFEVQADGDQFTYDPPNNEVISSEPLLQDPYESENVEVRASTIDGAGEGLFAKRDLKKGQLVALYSGFTYDYQQLKALEPYCAKVVDSDNPCDKYQITTMKDATVLIKSPYDSTEHYRATLAWKANNHFDPDASTFFHDVEHPRFGLILAITAQKDINAGEEITVDYYYEENNSTEPAFVHHQWYHDQRKEYLERKIKMSDEKVDITV